MADEVIVFAGGGGKTTSIYTYAKKLAAEGKKALILTTTHMGVPKDRSIFSGCSDPKRTKEILDRYGYCVCGKPQKDREKITAWTDGQMKVLEGLADTVLIEGDGAKRMPLKVPACYEPVIPDWSSRLVIVLGLSGLGMPCARAVHRWQLLFQKDEIVTEETYIRIFSEGYGPVLKGTDRAWKKDPVFMLNQADDEGMASTGCEIFRKLERVMARSFSWEVVSLHKKKRWEHGCVIIKR